MAIAAGTAIVVGAAANILGGLLSNRSQKKAAEKQLALYREQMDRLAAIDLPEVEKMQIVLKKLQSQGELMPELEQALTQAQSEFHKIKADPRLKEAQLTALERLKEIGESKDLSIQERSKLSQTQEVLSAKERGARQAIMQNAKTRGLSGSGLELQAMLANQQGTTAQAAREGFDIASSSQARALEAIMKSGQLGGDIRSQDYQEKSDKARAQDSINRFNTATRQDTMNRNINRKNQAAAANLSEKQRISDTNTLAENDNRRRNADLHQRDYENKLKRAGYQGQMTSGQAQAVGNRAQAQSNAYAGIGQAIGQTAGALGKYYIDEEAEKKKKKRDNSVV